MIIEPDQNVDDFLEHFGVSGMKWGQRKSRSQRQASARAKGLGQKQLRGESKRINEAGGGIRGTVRVRNEMKRSGELSKSDARKGTARIARNVAIGLAGAAAVGLVLNRSGGTKITELNFPSVDAMVSGLRNNM